MKKINYDKVTKEYTLTLKKEEVAILHEMLNTVKKSITLKGYS